MADAVSADPEVAAAASGFPSGEDVGEQLTCLLVPPVCATPDRCWTRGICDREARSLPPGHRRIRDVPALRKAMLRWPECPCGARATEAHHVLFRSHGGDDLIENILPLCHPCHMAMHRLTGDAGRAHRQMIGDALRPETISYLEERLGGQSTEWLLRHYGRTA